MEAPASLLVGRRPIHTAAQPQLRIPRRLLCTGHTYPGSHTASETATGDQRPDVASKPAGGPLASDPHPGSPAAFRDHTGRVTERSSRGGWERELAPPKQV